MKNSKKLEKFWAIEEKQKAGFSPTSWLLFQQKYGKKKDRDRSREKKKKNKYIYICIRSWVHQTWFGEPEKNSKGI